MGRWFLPDYREYLRSLFWFVVEALNGNVASDRIIIVRYHQRDHRMDQMVEERSRRASSCTKWEEETKRKTKSISMGYRVMVLRRLRERPQENEWRKGGWNTIIIIISIEWDFRYSSPSSEGGFLTILSSWSSLNVDVIFVAEMRKLLETKHGEARRMIRVWAAENKDDQLNENNDKSEVQNRIHLMKLEVIREVRGSNNNKVKGRRHRKE